MHTEGDIATLLRQFAHKALADYAGLRIERLPAKRSSIAYHEFGDSDGYRLLCLHGLSMSGLCFEQYRQQFVAPGVRAIAPAAWPAWCSSTRRCRTSWRRRRQHDVVLY